MIKPEVVQEVLHRYQVLHQTGMRIERETGVSCSSVYNILARHGIKRRPRCPFNRPRHCIGCHKTISCQTRCDDCRALHKKIYNNDYNCEYQRRKRAGLRTKGVIVI